MGLLQRAGLEFPRTADTYDELLSAANRRYEKAVALFGDGLQRNEETFTSPEAYEVPYVIEERGLSSDHLHVSVIWDRWKDVPRAERGRVILDAYRQARNEQEMLRIKLAPGLTYGEAQEIGIMKILPQKKNP